MEPEKSNSPQQQQQPSPIPKHSVENLVISSHDVIGRSINANLTINNTTMTTITQPSLESSLDSSSLQSSASSASSPILPITSRTYKRELSKGSDTSDVAPLDSDSSSTNTKNKGDKLSEKGGGGGDKTTNKKKSSWYNVLYPTYKTRAEGFKRIFKELPSDERLVVDYSCALQRDILVHGRLYVSPNFLSFYANIFGWETSVSVPWRQVTSLTKEKTALVIPNAIQVSTTVNNVNDRLFFTSFGARDKTYLMLFRVWQNALLDQSFSNQELWQWIHACYGDELGLTSDDEDYVSATGLDPEDSSSFSGQTSLELAVKAGDLPPIEFPSISPLPESGNIDQAGDSTSSASNLSTNKNLNSPTTPSDEIMVPPISSSPPLPLYGASSDALQTDMSDTTESDVEKSSSTLPSCPDPHEGRQSLDHVYPIPVDQLFALLFTTSTFFIAFHTNRKTHDIQASSWQPNKEAGVKTRQVSFTITVNNPVGPKTAHVCESQTMQNCSRPGKLYVIDVEANQSGIPYGDSFYVTNHMCLTKMSETSSRLCVYSQLKYRKSVWGLVKGFIDKNTWIGMEDFYSSLHKGLTAESEALRAGEATSTGKRKSRVVRHRRARVSHLSSLDPTSIVGGLSSGETSPTIRSPLIDGFNDRGTSRTLETGKMWSWGILITLIALLVLNAVLYQKLWVLEAWGREQMVGKIDIPMFRNPPKTHDEWLKLLQHQELLHRREIETWRHFLETAVSLLRQAEDALQELQKTIAPSLFKTGGIWENTETEPHQEL